MLNDNTELKELIKEDLEISKKVYADTQKIRSYFLWGRIFKIVKFAIIIILAVAGYIYSKSYLDQLFKFYKSIIDIYPKIIK